MKQWLVFLSTLVSLTILALMPAPAYAESYGQLRALKRRAATVTRQKNDFVSLVLRSYGIPYESTEQGVIARIHLNDRWLNVNGIEIVPMVREGEGGFQAVAHEIFFYAEGEILHLVSPLAIR